MTVICMAEAARNLAVVHVLDATRDAYSRPAYGEVEWTKCAALLIRRGMTTDQAAEILLSRLPRWARESAPDYEHPTCADLEIWLGTTAGLNSLSHHLELS